MILAKTHRVRPQRCQRLGPDNVVLNCHEQLCYIAGRTASLLPFRYLDLPEPTQHSTRALESFLAGVEAKAFRIAQIALRHEDDALDAVQDAMLRLVRRYSHRPPQEWRPLFYRILENCVRDMQRRRSVRGRVLTWYRRAFGEDGPKARAIRSNRSAIHRPSRPRRRRPMRPCGRSMPRWRGCRRASAQAFLLRNLEGLDVARNRAGDGLFRRQRQDTLFQGAADPARAAGGVLVMNENDSIRSRRNSSAERASCSNAVRSRFRRASARGSRRPAMRRSMSRRDLGGRRVFVLEPMAARRVRRPRWCWPC